MSAAIQIGKKSKTTDTCLAPDSYTQCCFFLVEQSAIVQYLLNLMFQCSRGLNTHTHTQTQSIACVFFFVNVTEQDGLHLVFGAAAQWCIVTLCDMSDIFGKIF